jgi:hypothetical protein
VIATAAMDEAQRSAWCREKGVFPSDLQQWRENAMAALAQPEEARATPQETRQDRRRIKALEKDLRRKEKALAETTALRRVDLAARGFDPPRSFAAFFHSPRWNRVSATDLNLFQSPCSAAIKIISD